MKFTSDTKETKQIKESDGLESYEAFRQRVLIICGREISLEVSPSSATLLINKGIERQLTLYYTNPAKNSDKVYTISIVKTGSLYEVTGSYGRRGGKMKEEIKTYRPTTLGNAISVFNDVVQEKKTKKGYTENINGGL